MRHFSGDTNGIRFLMDDELDKIAGGDGEDTDDVVTADPDLASAGSWISNILTGAAAGYLASRMASAYEREGRVAEMFNPSEVAFRGNAWQNNGGTNIEVPAWTMRSGDIFIDTNQNGRPDTVLRTDTSGNVYENTGQGWQLVMTRR